MADTVESLLAFEELKRLKARYCRFLDTKNWTAWRALFTDDFVSDTSAASGEIVTGADAFVDFVRGLIGGRVTVHQVLAPDLEVTSETTARGHWALHDVVEMGTDSRMQGYGYYEETYARVDGSWLIARSTLTRVRADIETISRSVD